MSEVVAAGRLTSPSPALRPRIPVLITVRELDQGGIERDVAKIATHLDPARFERWRKLAQENTENSGAAAVHRSRLGRGGHKE